MIKIKPKMRRAIRKFKRHLSDILTGLAIVGVAGTAVASAYSTKKTIDKLVPEDESVDVPIEEVVKVAVVEFIPTFVMIGITTGCILSAHKIGKKQLHAMTIAYITARTCYNNYVENVALKYGNEAAREIFEDMEKEIDLIDQKSKGEDTKESVYLFHEPFGDKWFESTLSDVLLSEIEVNRLLTFNGEVKMNEFYQFLGIDKIYSEDVGWDWDQAIDYFDGYLWIGFHHVEREKEDGTKYIDIVTEMPPYIFGSTDEENRKIILQRMERGKL